MESLWRATMSEFKFACPICRQHIKSDSSASGTHIECPTCFQKIVVPQAPADTESKLILSATQAPAKRAITEIASAPAPATRRLQWLPLLWGGLAVVVLAGAVVTVAKLGGFKWLAPERTESSARPEAITPRVSAAADARWRLDLSSVPIPSTAASGRILGREFNLERATIQNSTLALRQGPGWPPDVGVTILLPKHPPQDYAGKEFIIATNFPGRAPRVVLRTKDDQQQPVNRNVNAGYAMKLEFGKVAQKSLPGRIYLCTPDEANSVVVGSFSAEIRKPSPPKPKTASGTPPRKAP